ncbi:amidohydrolase family protein [Pseudofrankia inefficax]|uniref:Amidohydrolase 2 n=1 Tax=Pseudofrankia inefficax (strain DSM 45817 / CECT 9037 / DDB 130130 / EuI1c) TaxID=298654 RepID=E3J901_PSEI1|nr:amidohydrolase family protein [Pseudofrankia inefficax]ADP80880.1 amidohydrolase 2 [Pseudofrankia inefficax]
MSLTVSTPAADAVIGDTDRYLIVSSDSHAGPALEKDLRPYCPPRYLADFDSYADRYRRALSTMPDPMIEDATQPALDAYAALLACDGLHDPHAFLRDMDAEGIATQVIFAGGGNKEPLPWSDGFNAGDPNTDPALRAAGGHIWNQWLADFASVGPERLLGVMQIPIWDIPAAVDEIHWGKEHGLRAINFPAPRPDYPAYNDPVYEPFWSAVEEIDLPLVCHVASGMRPTISGRGALMIFATELQFYSRRAFGQMAFGGVFDRHPRLRLGFVEQRAGWVAEHIKELDSCYVDPRRDYSDKPDRSPGEYWRENCFVGCSFMARYEAELRHDIGLNTLLWGSDYPHVEGTWRRTPQALRKTFAGLPRADVRAILGDNALRVYGLDESVLRPVADRIGPTAAELDRPLPPDEHPAHLGLAFREFGPFA